MGGGLVQIANYGLQDIFLTENPTVSFYKQSHKRYTNFAIETHSQTFLDQLDFGQESELVIDNYGDLLYRMYLVVDIPGFSLSTKEERLDIDPHLLNYLKENDRVSSNVYSLTDMNDILRTVSDAKLRQARKFVTDDISLIDIEFLVRYWANRLANYPDKFVPRIKAIIEKEIPAMIKDLMPKSNRTGQTSAWVNNLGNELIDYYEISVGNQIVVSHPGSWLTAYHNLAVPQSKRACYNRLIGNMPELINPTSNKPSTRLYIPLIPWFSESASQSLPLVSIKQPITIKVRLASLDKLIDVPNLSLDQVSLLTERIFLDDYERDRFIKHRHEYLVHQLQYEVIDNINDDEVTVEVNFHHPTKYVTWTFEYEDNQTPKIESMTLLINDKELSGGSQDYVIFDAVQPYMHFPNSNGQAVYSFCLHPLDNQPSGSINLSRLDRFGFRIVFKERIKPVTMKVYAQSINVFRIAGSFGSFAFV